MNIPEYHQCDAERCDNGETVDGYYSYSEKLDKHYILCYYEHEDASIMGVQYGKLEVKPETVRRVAVKPIKYTDEDGDMYKLCPNCECVVEHMDDDIVVGIMKCCEECGMALDWTDV